MKIGILTYHRSHNYGALLQAYALKQFLIQQGYSNVEFVDYFPDYHWKMYANIQRKSLRNLTFKELLLYPYYYCFEFIPLYILKEKRRKGFLKFIDNYIVPKSKDYQNQEYDIVIYGSDQIWRKQNKKTCPGFNKMYFGDERIKAKKRIAYSASMGVIDLAPDDKEFLSESLKNFDAVSVREKDLYETVKNLTVQKIYQTLDPVFLLNKKDWVRLYPKRLIKKNYILLYNFQPGKIAKEIANQSSKLLNIPIIELTGGVNQRFYRKGIKPTLSPSDFISLFIYTDFVISSSFHGVAFAIIFEKQFYTHCTHKPYRIISLLESLRLGDRFIKDISNVDINNNINYNELQPVIEREKNISKEYLLNAIRY